MTPIMDEPDVVCIDCGHPIPLGAPYSQRPIAVGPVTTDVDDLDDVIVEVVCPFGFCRGAA